MWFSEMEKQLQEAVAADVERQMRDAAKQTKVMYDSFRKAGFGREESLYIVVEVIKASVGK